MKETFVAILAVGAVMFLMVTCVDCANGKASTQIREEIGRQGPTYILPRDAKSRHVLRWVCYWGDGKLTCGPAIGTKFFEEWK